MKDVLATQNNRLYFILTSSENITPQGFLKSKGHKIIKHPQDLNLDISEINLFDVMEEYHQEKMKLGGVIKSFNSEEELLKFIYRNIPIAVKPKSKLAKGQLTLAFKSANAFEQVCKHLAKKIFNVC